MKKLKSLLIIICLVLVCGCTKDENKELIIKLNANPTTGYSWVYEIEENDIIKIEDEYSQNENCAKEAVGCGGTQTLKITPLKEGKVILYLTYKRSWEETEYDKTATYEITVDKNLKISESHIGSYFEE